MVKMPSLIRAEHDTGGEVAEDEGGGRRGPGLHLGRPMAGLERLGDGAVVGQRRRSSAGAGLVPAEGTHGKSDHVLLEDSRG